jgi:hypothetical protein
MNIDDLLEVYLTERGMISKSAWVASIVGATSGTNAWEKETQHENAQTEDVAGTVSGGPRW